MLQGKSVRKFRKTLGNEILSVQPLSHRAVGMTLWPAQDCAANPASWSEYTSPGLLLWLTCPPLTDMHAQHSQILLQGDHGAGSQLMQISSKLPLLQLDSQRINYSDLQKRGPNYVCLGKCCIAEGGGIWSVTSLIGTRKHFQPKSRHHLT